MNQIKKLIAYPRIRFRTVSRATLHPKGSHQLDEGAFATRPATVGGSDTGDAIRARLWREQTFSCALVTTLVMRGSWRGKYDASGDTKRFTPVLYVDLDVEGRW